MIKKNVSMWKSILAVTITIILGTFSVTQAHEDSGDGHLIAHDVGGVHIDGGLTWFLQGTDGAANDTAALTYTFDLLIRA